MVYPVHAIRVWFGKGRVRDAQYLNDWRGAPLTYSTDQVFDSTWNADRYEVILGKDHTGELFRRAALLALHNQFYPPEVMTTTSDFSLERRPVRVGDRVLQRIRIFQLWKLVLLEVLAVNEITQVVEEPRQVGFTYTTTTAHSEIGEWSCRIEWRENDEVALVIEVVSRVRPDTSKLSQRLIRRLQLRAHKLSIDNFLRLMRLRPAPEKSPTFSVELLPVAMLLAAALLSLAVFLGYIRRAE